jgi:hypothetical protein
MGLITLAPQNEASRPSCFLARAAGVSANPLELSNFHTIVDQ